MVGVFKRTGVRNLWTKAGRKDRPSQIELVAQVTTIFALRKTSLIKPTKSKLSGLLSVTLVSLANKSRVSLLYSFAISIARSASNGEPDGEVNSRISGDLSKRISSPRPPRRMSEKPASALITWSQI